MLDPIERQRLLDEEHLRLLRVGHLIYGGTWAVGALFPLIYVGIGLMLMFVPVRSGRQGIDPRLFASFFVLLGLTLTFGLALFGGLQLYAARCLRLRRSRTFCLVVAAMGCISIPFGTALGICTFVVLGRPTVQAMFAAASAPTAPTPRAPLTVSETPSTV